MTKHHLIFPIIAVALILGSNLALSGYFQHPSKLRVKSVNITHYTAFLESKTSVWSSGKESVANNGVEPVDSKPVVIYDLEVKKEAICDFLASERHEKYLMTEICKNGTE